MPEPDYFSGHMGLGDWLRDGGATRAEEFAAEDLTKTDRLRALSDLIKFPSVPSVVFTAAEVKKCSDSFVQFRLLAGERLFAMRLRKTNGTGTLARNRGLSVDALISWAQTIGDAASGCAYEFEPHIDAEISSIILLDGPSVAVEAIKGSLTQLSKGVYDASLAYIRQGAIKDVIAQAPTEMIRAFLADVFTALRIPDSEIAELLKSRGFPIRDGMLIGYFEAICTENTVYFVDYNRVLGDLPAILEPVQHSRKTTQAKVLVKGRIGSPGQAKGVARVIDVAEPLTGGLLEGEIIVCRYTSPDLAPLMAVSAGVITEIGGVLSHAAVLCREIGIPSIVGANGALGEIRTGDWIILDADTGEVRTA